MDRGREAEGSLDEQEIVLRQGVSATRAKQLRTQFRTSSLMPTLRRPYRRRGSILPQVRVVE